MLEESIITTDLIRVGKATPFVNLTQLPSAEKSRAWNHLKTHHPATASLLDDMRRDPAITSLIETFGASICLERSLLKGMIVPSNPSKELER